VVRRDVVAAGLARPLQQALDLVNVAARHAEGFVMPAHGVRIWSVEQAVHLAS
jgi:hypothetical protein